MARYKVKAPDEAAYWDLLELLRGHVDLFVESPRRRLIGTGDLPTGMRKKIVSRGGEISEDRRYDLESPTG